jgi:hypothetical protein
MPIYAVANIMYNAAFLGFTAKIQKKYLLFFKLEQTCPSWPFIAMEIMCGFALSCSAYSKWRVSPPQNNALFMGWVAKLSPRVCGVTVRWMPAFCAI